MDVGIMPYTGCKCFERNVCHWCNKMGKMQKCARCGCAWYCSQKCQKRHYEHSHKDWCKANSKISWSFVPLCKYDTAESGNVRDSVKKFLKNERKTQKKEKKKKKNKKRGM